MASLDYDKKARVYRLRFRHAGRQYQRSLETSSRQEATAALARFQETQRLVKRGRLTIPADADPVEFLLSDGKDEKPAEPETLYSLGQVITLYRESLPAGAKEESTLYTEAIHIAHLKRLLPTRRHANQFTVADIQKYVNTRLREKRRKKPITAATVKKEVATLRVIWNWAIEHEYVSTACPVRRLVFPKRDQKPPFMTWDEIVATLGRGGLSESEEQLLWQSLFLRKNEVDDLLAHVERQTLPRFTYPMLLFAAHTGARRSELVRSRLEDLDFAARLVRIREKKRCRDKSVTYRYVPMTSQFERVFQEWSANHPGGQMTLAGDQGEAVNVDSAQYYFKRAIAGAKWAKLRGFHVLRHSFASNLAAAGVDQRVIDEFMGHQTEEMRRRYRHLHPEQRRSAIESVFGGDGKQPMVAVAS